MSDTILSSFLFLLSLGAAFWVFLRWRRKKNIWSLLAIVTFILAGAAFWLSRVIGTFLAVIAAALFLLGLWAKRGNQ